MVMELVKNIKHSKLVRNLLIALLGTVILAISSKIKIPFYPVPMTMQTFVVLFIGVAFGWRLGVSTIGLYLFEGIIGLPVFSGTPEKGMGIIYFTGPTMGYLLGFLVTVFLAGSFNFNKNIIFNFIKLTFATSFIYILGMLWLGSLIGWEKPIFKLGAQPFLLAELFKILLITLLVSKIKNFRSKLI
jgi:biotin transport system substrate-specific component